MIPRPYSPQNVQYHLLFFLSIRIRCIDYVQKQIRFDNFFKSGSKRRYQLMGKLSDKSNRIGNQDWKTLAELDAPDERIECRKQSARYQCAFVGERAKQCRFAGIGIAD